jgi:ubiquinone/menaquinone biosynthesis C-methylase UbiE
MRDLYTDEYRPCWEREMRWVLDRLAGAFGSIIDIASGRCLLVETMARELAAPIVASDFSPRVLGRDRRRLKRLGLDDRVSLLAFDARQSPFRRAALTTMASNLGLANVERPGSLADELRRILSGTFLSISLLLSGRRGRERARNPRDGH